jgi:hypothetical protein
VRSERSPSDSVSETASHQITMISGDTMNVMSGAEVRWFNESRDNYLSQTRFTETTDLRDLDRLIVMELMVFRLSQYLSQGSDYEGFEIDEALIRRNIREYSEQINRTKDSMGLTKKARNDAANSSDAAAYLSDLRMRAKVFGIHRVQQLKRALVLMNELSSIVGAYDRSDTEERDKLGFRDEKEILEWIRERMLPEFKEIDEHFRANQQRYWIREM